jgi:hypothetical protein
MGLGVWFSEDIAHVLRGAGEGVSLLVAQRGLKGAADVAYVAGYWAALRTVATSLGLNTMTVAPPPALTLEMAGRELTWEETP